MNKHCAILRGMPGCGKSTLAKSYVDYVYCSIDDYLIVNGEYKYDPDKIYPGVKYCERKFLKALEDGLNVVIDNTNLIKKDFAFYIKKATEAGYDVSVISIVGLSAEDSFKNNTHGVPLETCEKKFKQYKFIENHVIDNENSYTFYHNVHYMQLRANYWFSFNIVKRKNGDGCGTMIIDQVISEHKDPSKLIDMDGEYLIVRREGVDHTSFRLFKNKSFEEINYSEIKEKIYSIDHDGSKVFTREDEFIYNFGD